MSSMTVVQDKLLREELHHARLHSGLDVFVMPKRGFARKYASFATRYGSLDNHFIPPGGQPLHVPDGIAHFLEHTLFEKENGNASDWFSALGASANAYTSYLLTTYLFSATDSFSDNLNILLNFVLEPYFSEANVEKERGIIEQELMMYHDMPDQRLINRLLETMYAQHPVRIDIGGTVESIQHITPDLLRLCYDTFYHPSNMALFVVGDVEPQQVIDQVAANVDNRGFTPRERIERLFPDEPALVQGSDVQVDMMASRPRLVIGVKGEPGIATGTDGLRDRLMMGLVLRSMFGPSSDLYTQLYDAQLIDDTFSASYSAAPGYAHTMVGGETNEPGLLADALRRGIDAKVEEGISKAEFERLQRMHTGRFLARFNSLEYIAGAFLSHHFLETSLLDTVDVVGSLTADEVTETMRRRFGGDNMTVATLQPRKE